MSPKFFKRTGAVPRSSSAVLRPSYLSNANFSHFRVTGGELFEDIVAREFYSEADARYVVVLIFLNPSKAPPSREHHRKGSAARSCQLDEALIRS